MQRLHQHHPVHTVEEVHRPQQVEVVHQQHVDGARAAQDEGEAQHAHQRRGDDRDHREVREEPAAHEVVAHEEERDRDAQHRGAHHGGHPQDQRVPERAQVEAIGEEVPEVGQREDARLVGDRVVEDSAERIDQEQDQEHPHQPHPRRLAGATHRPRRPGSPRRGRTASPPARAAAGRGARHRARRP